MAHVQFLETPSEYLAQQITGAADPRVQLAIIGLLESQASTTLPQQSPHFDWLLTHEWWCRTVNIVASASIPSRRTLSTYSEPGPKWLLVTEYSKCCQALVSPRMSFDLPKHGFYLRT